MLRGAGTREQKAGSQLSVGSKREGSGIHDSAPNLHILCRMGTAELRPAGVWSDAFGNWVGLKDSGDRTAGLKRVFS
jgi:hypothetical protein